MIDHDRIPTFDELVAIVSERIGQPREIERGKTLRAWWGASYGDDGAAVDVAQNESGLRLCAKRARQLYCSAWIVSVREAAEVALHGEQAVEVTTDVAVEIAALAMGRE